MIVYVDKDYHCHASNDGTMTAVETDFFNGKCSSFIEGHVFVPPDCSVDYGNGITLKGESAFPWKDIRILKAYQEQYAAMLPEMQDMRDALDVLEVKADG